MAIVVLARDLSLDRQVAIKVLRPELRLAGPAERFLQEIQITAHLAHPHILPLYDSGEASGILYYVMPYVPGGSLRDRLNREKQLPVPVALDVASQVAEALDCSHRQGIVHRDIKPENILFSTGTHALVADFGIARVLHVADADRLSQYGLAVGTVPYMSPEQCAGNRDVDARSDVYALACVVYEMLAGETPFTGLSNQAISAKHLHQQPPSLRVVRPGVPASVQEAVTTGLAKVPADRFPTAGEFARALRRTLPERQRLFPWWARLAAGVGTVVAAYAAASLAPRAFTSARNTGTPDSDSALRDPKRIAVLYFDDRTPNRNLGYVANGLTEDLIDQLSQVQALHVISPNGVRQFQGRPVSVDSVARVLEVGTVVAGSVMGSQGRLRVTVRMIDAATGQQIQSRTLERPQTDLLLLRDSVATEVVQFLRERLGREIGMREQRTQTRSVKAWALVQQAGDLIQEGSSAIVHGRVWDAAAALVQADSLLHRAEAFDPKWIAPTVARGRLALLMSFVPDTPSVRGLAPPTQGSGAGGLSPAQILRGLDFADQALQRSPEAPEALALRGDLRYRLAIYARPRGADTLLPLAERDLEAAIRARPDLAEAWSTLGELYNGEGRTREAATAARRAFEVDAYMSSIRSVLSLLIFASLQNEEYGDANTWCRVASRRFSDDPRFTECQLAVMGWSVKGRKAADSAWRLVAAIEQRDSLGLLTSTWAYRRMWVAAVLARTGMNDSARAVVERVRVQLRGGASRPETRQLEAFVYLLMGEREEALRLLAAYLGANPGQRTWVIGSPWYRELRTDPGFRALVEAQP